MEVGISERLSRLSGIDLAGRGCVDAVLPAVYEELRALAASYLRRERPNHTLQPTALVNEIYIRLAGQSGINWEDRVHFMALAARAMRNALVNHALARAAEKRGGGSQPVMLDGSFTPARRAAIDPLILDEALTDLAARDARKAQVVEMRFYAGMTVEEIAHVLGVSMSTVEADWRMAKAYLSGKLAEN